MAWATKPKSFVSKTNLDSRAWEGINLGCSELSPAGYDIWVPPMQRVVSTSDVYVAECMFPWRPKGDNIVGDIPGLPTNSAIGDGIDATAAQPPGVPAAAASAQSTLEAKPPRDGESPKQAFASAANGAMAAASAASTKVLVLFSGDYIRPDGLGGFLRLCGFDVTMVDSDAKRGGDRLNDRFFHALLARIRSGHYYAVYAAPPCSTFSVARHFKSKSGRVRAGGRTTTSANTPTPNWPAKSQPRAHQSSSEPTRSSRDYAYSSALHTKTALSSSSSVLTKSVKVINEIQVGLYV